MACSACVKRKDVARPPDAKSTDELLSILLEVTTKEAVLTEKLTVTPKALDKIAAAPENYWLWKDRYHWPFLEHHRH